MGADPVTAATAEAQPTLAARFKPGDVALCTCSSAIGRPTVPCLAGDMLLTKPVISPSTQGQVSGVNVNHLYFVDLPQPVIPAHVKFLGAVPLICLSGVSGYYFEWRFSRVETRSLSTLITADVVKMANAIQAVRRTSEVGLCTVEALEAEGFGVAEIIEYGSTAAALATLVWG